MFIASPNKPDYNLAHYGGIRMERIGLHEAKTHLSKIVSQVSEGHEFTITRRGIPVAKLIPVSKSSEESIKQAFESAKKLRETLTLDGLSIRDLMEEGRR